MAVHPVDGGSSRPDALKDGPVPSGPADGRDYKEHWRAPRFFLSSFPPLFPSLFSLFFSLFRSLFLSFSTVHPSVTRVATGSRSQVIGKVFCFIIVQVFDHS